MSAGGFRSVASTDYRRAQGVSGVLADFNRAGVIESTDIHVATNLGRALGEHDQEVLLAVALLVAQTRAGSVCLDLETTALIGSDTTVGEVADDELAVEPLQWPQPQEWCQLVARSPLTQSVDPPITLRGTLLYLDRYVRHEDHLLAAIQSRRAREVEVDDVLLQESLSRLFQTDFDPNQRDAVETAVTKSLAVIAGGPGTGKTTTIAKVVAALTTQLASSPIVHPMIALSAPTGRAAARLQEAVQGAAAGLSGDEEGAKYMETIQASTLHRLLGWQPGNRSRFRHHSGNPLPHDVVIVDECSMISLALMDQLLDAVRPEARVVLVGDPRQLASVDAGSIFGDIVGPAKASDKGIGVVVLTRVHRFGGEIAGLAEAILVGDSDAAEELMRSDSPSIGWCETAEDADTSTARAVALAELEPHWLSLIDHAEEGDAAGASHAVSQARVLCAHREGPAGVALWNAHAFSSLASHRSIGHDPNGWFLGRPLMVTENDYQLGVFNGDSAVIVADSVDGEVAVFEREPTPLRVVPTRLGHVTTAFASTVHKSQGSQFGTVVVVLPHHESHVLSRELLYTAVTRATDRVIVVGSRASLVAAINRRSRRASGLGQALRGR